MSSWRLLFSICLLTSFLLPATSRILSPSQALNIETSSLEILSEIDLTNIFRHAEYFSSIQTRVTGYEGSEEAAEYIAQRFRDLGLKVEIQEYPLLVPVDHGANITILADGTTFKAFPLWPNLVQCSPTPPGGISGRLIYVGSGELEEFDGKEVSGSIILMDFNSMWNWINAAKLGAKAVVFIEPEDTTRMESETKIINTPLYFPRVYVKRDVGAALLQLISSRNEVTVNLKSSMAFEEKTGKNVIGILEGQELKDQIMLLTAHYDSWSPVPSLAPDAQASVRIASLLELARVLSANPPRRTIWFVAFSGHYQQAAGAREFTEQYCFQNQTYVSGTKKFIVLADLHLSADSPNSIWDSIQKSISDARNTWWINRVSRVYEPALPPDVLAHYQSPLSIKQHAHVIDPADLDSAPISNAGPWAFSYITIETLHQDFFSPTNNIDKIRLDYLEPQLKFALFTFNDLANLDLTTADPPLRDWTSGKRFYSPPGAAGAGVGFMTLIGRVEEFNYRTGFYQPVPNALVVIDRIRGEAAGLQQVMLNHMSVERFSPLFGHIIIKADEHGSYKVNGIEASSARRDYEFDIFAYVVDPVTGETKYAPNLGMYGGGGGILGGYQFQDVAIRFDRHPFFVKTIVFPCKSITLFDITDPYFMISPKKGLNAVVGNAEGPVIAPTSGSNLALINPLSLNEFYSHSTPISWGMTAPDETAEPLAMIYVAREADERYEVMLFTQISGAMSLVGILNNATKTNPAGYGITPDAKTIPVTAFSFLEGIYWITEERLVTLSSYNVRNSRVIETHEKSGSLLREAQEALASKQYSRAYALVREAWNIETNVYLQVTDTAHDVVNTSVAFYVMLIPFAFVFERLVFQTGGKKRLVTILTTFAVFIVFAYLLHPGFRLASSLLSVVLGLSMFSLTMLVIGVISSQAIGFAKKVRVLLTGAHYAEISRTSATSLAFSIGVLNMRKRRLRSILTMLTIILLNAAFVSLTAASTFSSSVIPEAPGLTLYNGLMLKRNQGLDSLSSDFLSFIYSKFPNATVAPRAWYFPTPMLGQGFGALDVLSIGTIYSSSKTADIMAILGLTPEETEVTGLSSALISGRWFLKHDRNVCILPKTMASQLNVSVWSTVRYLSLNFTIIGIVDDVALKIYRDLDQRTVAPIGKLIIQGHAVAVPIDWEYTVFLPYEYVRNVLDGDLRVISVKSNNQTANRDVAFQLLQSSWGDLGVFAGFNGRVGQYMRGIAYEITGLQLLPVPLAIAVMVIFLTMLGNVYERTKEISVYSSVGLSPRHVTGMFLSEIVAFALIGAVIGYLGGLLSINIFLATGVIPPSLNVNLSSSFVFLTIGLSALATLLATVYPVLTAGRLVTPSLERRWKIRTKPVGDEWSIPFPFTTVTAEETKGALAFVGEFLNLYTSSEIGQFWVRELVQFREEFLTEEQSQVFAISTIIALPPWDVGFTEETRLMAIEADGKFEFQIYLKYLGSLDRRPWLERNPGLIDAVRKQLLLWRAFSEKEKEKYAEMWDERAQRSPMENR